MNRLELRYTPVTRPGESKVLHGVTPFIDGVSLIELARVADGSERGPLLAWWFPNASDLETDAIEILDCSCTDHGCGGLDVRVRRFASTVIWDVFLNPVEEPVALGPFEFDADLYDEAADRIDRTLQSHIPLLDRARAALGPDLNAVFNRGRRIVGVVGGPGAGKSTIANGLPATVRPPTAVLPMDGFHLPQVELVRLGRRDRMGAPDTFDVDAFVATLEALRVGTSEVRAPGFDRVLEEAIPNAIEIGADIRLVIVEGNYLLHDRDGWERVRPLLDTVIYLAPDDAVRRERLIARHIAFGKTPQEAEEWVARSDDPNAALIAATAHRADRILRE